MSLTRIDLAITLTVSSDCSTVTLSDTTGAYPETEGGYGRPSGATSASVVTVTIVVNLSDGTYFTYVLTSTAGTISAATLALGTGTATNIFSEVGAIAFPLVNFDLFADYGVTLPTVGNNIVEVDYTVQGISGGLSYNYTTSSEKLVDCEICCCLVTKASEIDLSCKCAEDKMWNFIVASTCLEIASYSTQVGNNENAIIALNKAVTLCDAKCDC